ncbi:hypothetical protein HDV63DRAFT_413164 [Trichoderma sp. SZMC 28014]
MTQRRWPLPPEITERIIELPCLDRRYSYFRTIFWQELVERRMFRNLGLNRARLADVDRIVYGDSETAEKTMRNSALFSETMRLFFDIFSRWTPLSSGLHRERAGISLCITAFSSSDVDRCGKAEMTRRERRFGNRDIFADRYIHSILRLLPATDDLAVVESVLEENKKKDLELRRQSGDALAQMRCPNAEVELTCSYEVPKDRSSIPPTLIGARGVDNAFARGMRTWTQQLKRLFLSGVMISPEMFYAVASDEWPHLEQTWLLEFNLEDSPLSRPSPVVDLDDYTQDSLAIEVPAPEDMYEYNFRTRPVATEMDQIHQGLARAVQRMPVLQELHHAFLYKSDANRGVATAHWGSLPGYTPAEEVVELWKEMAEVRGIQLEILIDENEV